MTSVWVISDTHGAVGSDVLALLRGADRIIHAGDIGDDSVLMELEAIAPLTAVRGNMDRAGMVARLPARATMTVGGIRFVVQHAPFAREFDPEAAGADVLAHGHTHEPSVKEIGGVLVVDPGSAAAGRGGVGPSLAVVEIAHGRATAKIVSI